MLKFENMSKLHKYEKCLVCGWDFCFGMIQHSLGHTRQLKKCILEAQTKAARPHRVQLRKRGAASSYDSYTMDYIVLFGPIWEIKSGNILQVIEQEKEDTEGYQK